jgi:hypothetical protein
MQIELSKCKKVVKNLMFKAFILSIVYSNNISVQGNWYSYRYRAAICNKDERQTYNYITKGVFVYQHYHILVHGCTDAKTINYKI